MSSTVATHGHPSRARTALLLALPLVGAQIADVATTYVSLRHGNEESNPAMAPLLATHGIMGALVAKAILIAGPAAGMLVGAVALPEAGERRFCRVALAVAAGVMLGVAGHNVLLVLSPSGMVA